MQGGVSIVICIMGRLREFTGHAILADPIVYNARHIICISVEAASLAILSIVDFVIDALIAFALNALVVHLIVLTVLQDTEYHQAIALLASALASTALALTPTNVSVV